MTAQEPHLHDSLEALKSDVSARIRSGPQERARRAMHASVAAHVVIEPSHLLRRLATVAASAILALIVAGAVIAHHTASPQLSNTQLASQYLHSAETYIHSAQSSSNPGPLLARAHDALAKAKPLLPANHSDPLWKAWNTDTKEVEHEQGSTTPAGDSPSHSPEQSDTTSPTSQETGPSSSTGSDDSSSGAGHDS